VVAKAESIPSCGEHDTASNHRPQRLRAPLLVATQGHPLKDCPHLHRSEQWSESIQNAPAELTLSSPLVSKRAYANEASTDSMLASKIRLA
jgi:hypothetical protein